MKTVREHIIFTPQWMQANTNGAHSPAKQMQQVELQVGSLTMPTSIDHYLCDSPVVHHTLYSRHGNVRLW